MTLLPSLSTIGLAQDDLRPLKPALPEADPSLWPWILAAVGLAFAIGGVAWFVRRRRTRGVTPTPLQQLRAALDDAAAALDAGDTAGAVDRLNTGVRGFLAASIPVDAHALTDDELLVVLEPTLPPELRADMSASFRRWEAIRFAGGTGDELSIPVWIEALIVTIRDGASPHDTPQAAR